MKRCPTCNNCYDDEVASCPQQNHDALVNERSGSRLIAGKYRLESLLGRGGMGAVYVGTQIKLARQTAVKLLQMDFILEEAKRSNPRLNKEPQALERFRRHIFQRFEQEAHAAALLNHPNVVHIYEYDVLPRDEAYISMELLRGQTLQEYISTSVSKKLRIDVAHAVTRLVAHGVRAAHNKGIVHRDLKPANIILLSDDDGQLQAKVVDFGLAKLRERNVSVSDLTDPGMMIGTVRYMSPEQCQGKELDSRSDIYSLGIILFEMLAGQHPFYAPNAMAMALNHISERAPSLSNYRPDAPAGTVELVRKSLEKEPALRPQTLTEFLRLLHEVQQSIRLSQAFEITPAYHLSDFEGNEETTLPDGEDETIIQSPKLSSIVSQIARAYEPGPEDEDKKDKAQSNTDIAVSFQIENKSESSKQTTQIATENRVESQESPSLFDGTAIAANKKAFEEDATEEEIIPQPAMSPLNGLDEEVTVVTQHDEGEAKQVLIKDFGGEGKPDVYASSGFPVEHEFGAIEKHKPGEKGENSQERPAAKSAQRVESGLSQPAFTAETERPDARVEQRTRKFPTSLKLAIVSCLLLLVIFGAYQFVLSYQFKRHSEMADAYLRNGDYDKAVREYTEAIKLNMKAAEAYKGRGQAYERNNDFASALADYDKAIELTKSDPKLYQLRGSIYERRKDFNRAASDYTEAIRLSQTSDNYFQRGNVYYQMLEYDKAIADYSAAINLNPDDYRAYAGRSLASIGQGKYAQAINDSDKAIQLKPDDDDAYNNRGIAYAYQGDYDKALADYSNAIRLNPKNALAYGNRGHIYFEQGDYELALENYNTALRLVPQANVYKSRALLYRKLNKPELAEADLAQATRLQQVNAGK